MKVKTVKDSIRFYPENDYDIFLCGMIAAKSDYWDRMFYSKKDNEPAKPDYLEITQMELLEMLRETK